MRVFLEIRVPGQAWLLQSFWKVSSPLPQKVFWTGPWGDMQVLVLVAVPAPPHLSEHSPQLNQLVQPESQYIKTKKVVSKKDWLSYIIHYFEAT